MSKKKAQPTILQGIEKAPTGIKGFDAISFGGIPRGHSTLICGSTGCGKTLMALEILIRGALYYNEPGLFLAFEETKEDLVKNIASMGFDLEDLQKRKLIYIDYIQVEPSHYVVAGEYDLDGLFIRIENGIKKIGAKRIAIDTIEILFSSAFDTTILRSELKRLFNWLKEKQLTTIVTGEEGGGLTLTRHGTEEYVADCVIALTNRVIDDLYTRRLQIVKYRGSYHETNLFPFIIGQGGIMLLPVTSLEMHFPSTNKQISTGIAGLDRIIDGGGYYEGSSILISGSSGSGKTTFAGAFAQSVCDRNQKCLFLSYEESEGEIVRNLAPLGIDFKKHLDQGRLQILSTRPTRWGLERHLGSFMEAIEAFQPNAVVIDPVNAFFHSGTSHQVYSILLQMIDFLKDKQVTFLITNTSISDLKEEMIYGMTSIIDTWILLKNDENNGELNRELLMIKSRGMKHSNQVSEFLITAEGIQLKDPYYGEAGVLTGTARIVQENKDKIDEIEQRHSLEKLYEETNLQKKLIEMQIQKLNAILTFQAKEAKVKESLIHLKSQIHHSGQQRLKKERQLKKNHKKNEAVRGKKRTK